MPKKLEDLFSLDKLAKHIEERNITARRHPSLPLTIYNYANKCQYESLWDEVTMQCRGLIADDQGYIVGRPFSKFFNLNQRDRPETHEGVLPKDKPLVLEKLDGCLGILCFYDKKPVLSSRGSFTSPMAEWAQNHFDQNLWKSDHPYVENDTYMFEIISPVSRIVVHYNFSDLVLLAIVHNDTGVEARYEELESFQFLAICEWQNDSRSQC